VSAQTFMVYVEQLIQYDLRDIQEAVTHLSLQKRAEGETAFPCLGNVNDEVRSQRSKRLTGERQRREREEREAEARDRREHPENYFAVHDLAAGMIAKMRGKSLASARPAQQSMQKCSQCGALSRVSPAFLRQLADRMEQKTETRS
jgi:hypothetical protein